MTQPKYLGPCSYNEYICPFGCPKGTKLNNLGGMTTLVGWSSGEDPNHHTYAYECTNCKQEFTRHHVPLGEKVWYEVDKKVLLGIPGCYETIYEIHCESCGGWMRHSSGGRVSFAIVDGKHGPKEPQYYKCQDCGIKMPDFRYGIEYMERGICG